MNLPVTYFTGTLRVAIDRGVAPRENHQQRSLITRSKMPKLVTTLLKTLTLLFINSTVGKKSSDIKG